ncbi:methionyl-tRNA formyltransferase [Flavobacterium sp. 20NA77.7]|uniref:Methionyl-tRNA formyltransferase n=1 Tax=Flavobacterium nakdongensis TaxID=3073563 RepID=A0ABY9RDC4_9FLAO|nr:methionyl-tRNA formyltransferase [Flavobacterium sp. 20NA77.7]WMW78844.1 methionyl-tRNA formyltransferase [Flavobacterium sp. 20NA77.7]
MEALRIVFMGTPDFAVGILDEIYTSGYNVVAVITAPDKPAGRGQKVSVSAVKTYALEKNLALLQPTNLKDEQFLAELASYNANLQVVVAFRMLPEAVWKMPKYGTFNLHASLLPQYRGAAPINWALINGEKETGVTTFFIDDKIDTGAIILNKTTPIHPDENAGNLHDRLQSIGSEVVIETLERIAQGNVTTTLQTETADLKTAYKLNKDNCKINWDNPGLSIHNHIRGLSPYPAAWTFIKDGENEWNVKIYEARFRSETHTLPLYQIHATKKELSIIVKDGYIDILSLQFPGKKRMLTHELLNGIQLSAKAFVL